MNNKNHEIPVIIVSRSEKNTTFAKIINLSAMKKIISLYVLFLGLIAGCISCNYTQKSENNTDGTNNSNIESSEELRKKHLDALALNNAEKHCVDKINKFAFSLLHRIAKNHDGSFVVAPLSLASAIAIPGNGANGEVRDSIEQILGPITDANSFYKKYLAALPHNKYSDCLLLNYLAVNGNVPINDAFSKTVSTNFNAAVNNHDFGDVHSVDQINDWFHKQSLNDTIRVIETLDPKSSLYLINALEYDALWNHFKKNNTFLDDFITDKGNTLKIPIMYNPEVNIPYYKNVDYQAVTIPYLGSCYRMLIIMPNTKKLSTFRRFMTHELFVNVLNSFCEPREIVLQMPRFKCESDLSMTELLKEMLPSVFYDKGKGFNAISIDPVAITDINHKTSIEVSEEGTKAYSVTVEEFTKSLKPEFIANHPFFYFVYDEATRAILLMGQFCGDGALFRDGDS